MKKMRRKKTLVGFCSKAFMLTILVLNSATSLWAASHYAPHQRVTTNLKKATIRQVFAEIRKQTTYNFVYSDDQMDRLKDITIVVKNETVENVLDKVLEDTPYTYTIEGNAIAIVAKSRMTPVAKEKNIRGNVKDKSGQPLTGVSVFVKGTTTGATTDLDGNYTLPLDIKPDAMLVFSFIGMETKEIKLIPGKTVYNVQLEEAVVEIQDAVITGLYTRSKESFTGSSEVYKSAELKRVGNQNVLQSLKILDPSFVLNENNIAGSNPNSELDINVRGATNIVGLGTEYNGNPNQPLFILDGFETTLSAITDLSMDRVESITILKDAASTAIYGSKAANGVIVVETKKPEAGKLRLNYTGNFNVSWADLSDYNMMNALEKLEYELLAGYYGNTDENGVIINEIERENYYKRLYRVKSGMDTYWMNEPLRTGLVHSHNVFAEGGDAALRYGIGANYQSINGVMKKSSRDIINGNFSLTYRIKKLSVSNQTNITNTKIENPLFNFADFVQTNPFYSKYDDNGEVYKLCEIYFTGNGYSLYYTNPMWDMEQNSYDQSEQLNFVNNFQIEYNPFSSLRIRGRFGMRIGKTRSEQFLSPEMIRYMQTPAENSGSYTESNEDRKSYNGSLDIIYGNTWGKHMLNMIGGAQLSEDNIHLSGYTVYGYSSDKFSNPNFSLGFLNGGHPLSTTSKTRASSFYFNMNYSYGLRYLIDFNLRSDGSSVFGVDNPFSTTWSLGLAYNLHNESFFPKNDIVNHVRLRYSIGNPGNQNFDAKLSNDVYIYSTTYPNMFGLATAVYKWGNSGLRWQRSRDQNWGIDIYMLNNRMRLTADYFIKKTDPLLLNITIPPSSGVTSIPTNMGAMKNEGVTFIANYAIIRTTDVNWNINANLRHIRSTYYNLGDLLEKYNESGRKSGSLKRYYDGASVTALWAVPSKGIDPATGNELFIKKNGSYTYKWDVEDEIVCGDSTPDVEGTFGTYLNYKGFSLNVNFTYRYGGQNFLSTLYNKVENINSESVRYNQDKRALYNRWKKPGDEASFKRIDDQSYTPMSSRFIADENTLQCSSLSIGYQKDNTKWLTRLGLSSINFRIYGTDLFRFSTIKEERGINYPFARSVSASLNLGF